MIRRIAGLIPLAALVILASCEPAADANRQPAADAGVVVEDAWVRPARSTETSRASSAAYFVLHNDGRDAVRLVAVEADEAEAAEIHESLDDDGVMRMRPVEAVEVPAGRAVVFEPGGLHVMLVRLQRDLAEGDSLRLTLVFENGARADVSAAVRPAVF